MRVKKNNRGYTIFATDNEFALFERMLGQFDIEEEWKNMSSGERRSWSRRIRHGNFLRIDNDVKIGRAHV